MSDLYTLTFIEISFRVYHQFSGLSWWHFSSLFKIFITGIRQTWVWIPNRQPSSCMSWGVRILYVEFLILHIRNYSTRFVNNWDNVCKQLFRGAAEQARNACWRWSQDTVLFLAISVSVRQLRIEFLSGYEHRVSVSSFILLIFFSPEMFGIELISGVTIDLVSSLEYQL